MRPTARTLTPPGPLSPASGLGVAMTSSRGPRVRLVRYEWRRLGSLRSTWLIAGAALLLTALVSGLLAYSAVHNTDSGFHAPRNAWAVVISQGASLGAPLAVGFLGALYGLQGWAEEVTGGMAATTLTTFPRRIPVALARFVSIATASAVLTVAACVVAAAAGLVFLGAAHTSGHLGLIAVKSVRVIAYSTALAVIAGALCVLLRSPMVAAFVLLLVPWLLEPLITELFFIVPFLQPHIDLLQYLPFRALSDMAADYTFTGGFEIGPPHLALADATAESAAFTTALALLAAIVFWRRDPLKQT